MADVKKIATRDSYGKALAELGAQYDNLVVLDADLAGATKTATFQKAFPDRFFDCGIAEANMICMAAGLSTTGLVPFASSFAMFAAGRAFEQIRNSVGYPHLNVKIGATHGGISVGEDGASHQCCEDFAVMRTIPGMVVMSPADDVEARAMVKAAYEYVGPVYIRFGRAAVPVVHEEGMKFEIGKGEIMRDGADVAIIANGPMVYEALVAAEELAQAGINAMVINMATIKPLDEELVLSAAKKCGRVITCEEHSIIGGLGEAVCSLLCEKLPTPVRRIGVNDVFGESGPAAALLKKYGLSAENIVNVAKDFCGK
jgi:transketolase